LSLQDPVPDHSTFSKNRHGRFRESGAFRHLFESVLHRCMTEGLVRDEGFAADASIVKADAQRQRGVSGEEAINWGPPDEALRPVREYLAALEETNDSGATRKQVSLTDPAATWTAAPGGPAFYAYSTNYLIDLEAGIIIDVEASAVNKTAEVQATRAMIERVEHKLEMKPSRFVGDTNYGSAAMLGWLVDEKQIEPHVPVWDKSNRQDGTFSTSDFIWDEQAGKKVEILFAHLKRILKIHTLRLRGFSGAQDEFLLAATAQNLRRMAKWLMPRVPKVNPALA
jgi:hypothetical protein